MNVVNVCGQECNFNSKTIFQPTLKLVISKNQKMIIFSSCAQNKFNIRIIISTEKN